MISIRRIIENQFHQVKKRKFEKHRQNIVVILVRTISLKTRPIVSSPIWKRQNPLNILEGISTEIYSDQSIDLPMSPSSTTSSDRDSLSLQSNSSESNSQRISTNSFDFRPSVFVEAQPILHGEERLTTLRLDETFRRRCYRVGLNIFNKFVSF